MSNMSYCRFQNTLNDLRDCEGTLEDILDNMGDEGFAAALASKLSAVEKVACFRLVKVCRAIVETFDNEGLDENSTTKEKGETQ